MAHMQLRERTYYFDYLRFLAAIAVLVSHVADELIQAPWDPQNITFFSPFNTGNLFDSASRYAVNIFFFISGALLLDENHTFNLKKHWFKLFFALIGWTIFYSTVSRLFIFNNIPLRIQEVNELIEYTTVTHPAEIFKVISNFLQRAVVFHLWFIYRLLASYFAFPFLRIITTLKDEQKKKKIIEYALIAWAVSNVLIPTLRNFTLDIGTRIVADFMPTYVGLPLLGYYLNKYPINIKTRYLFLIWLVSLAFIFGGIYHEFTKITEERRFVWSFNNGYIYVISNALAIFLLAKRYLNRPGRCYTFISKFSAVSFEFYLSHIFILALVFNIWSDWNFFLNHALWTIPLTVFITAAITYQVAKILAFTNNRLLKRK